MSITSLDELAGLAKIGSIVPVVKIVEADICPLEYFAKLTSYGQSNCMLLESAEIAPKYGEYSIGIPNPCLKLEGFGEKFMIVPYNELGQRIIEFVLPKMAKMNLLKHIETSDKGCVKGIVSGTLSPEKKSVSEEERLKLKNHTDIIRAFGFAFAPVFSPAVRHLRAYAGMFGAFAYDFIDRFEELPKNEHELTQDKDYEIFFADNLFVYEHKKKKLYEIANALITDITEPEIEAEYRRCCKIIEFYEERRLSRDSKRHHPAERAGRITSDVSKEEFCGTVVRVKQHISNGDIFQAVISRTLIADYNYQVPPLEVYKALRSINPSPYMFYMNINSRVLLGASPEKCISVLGENEKTVEIRPIAGTKPRGIIEGNKGGNIEGKIDMDLDSRYEAELKLDAKELAEHMMLVDLARNDIAKVCIPGTRHVDELLVAEKYSHVQHLVSNVSGTLKPEYDALHAYLATMNMGTLTGAPKVEAMKLIRTYEKNRRGYYGGSVFYLTPSGEFDSAITIRSIRIIDDKAYVRAGAGIVHGSVPEKEFDETEKKAMACIVAIKSAGGVKYEQ